MGGVINCRAMQLGLRSRRTEEVLFTLQNPIFVFGLCFVPQEPAESA